MTSDRSVEERAWGFSEAEYAQAFALVFPKPTALREVHSLFTHLSADPHANVGGDDALFGLLSLISESATVRVLGITHWSLEELKQQQEAAKTFYRTR